MKRLKLWRLYILVANCTLGYEVHRQDKRWKFHIVIAIRTYTLFVGWK